MPDSRRKGERRKDDIPAAVLGGFLREDRRKGADRRRGRKDASTGARSRSKDR